MHNQLYPVHCNHSIILKHVIAIKLKVPNGFIHLYNTVYSLEHVLKNIFKAFQNRSK